MAEVAEAYSLEEAANDLIEAPASSAPAVYDPGTIEGDTPAESRSRGGLTVEQAAELIDDDGPGSGHRGGAGLKPLVLSGEQQLELINDLQARHRWVQQAGENVAVSAAALADWIITQIVPPHPSAEMANTDPVGYLQAQAVHEQWVNVAVQVAESAQAVVQHNLAQANWATAQIQMGNSAVEKASFLEAFPQGTNPKWIEQFRARVTRTAEACGYHASDVDTLTDHRAFKVLDLAATALERRQGAKREGPQQSRAKPRLVANGGSLTMSEAMDVDFD